MRYHQEQDAPGPGELDQPVDEADGGEGLAAACGHLDQGAGLVAGERPLQATDGDDLGGPELEAVALRNQRRHVADLGEEGGGRDGNRGGVAAWLGGGQQLEPGGQSLRTVEGEYGACPGLRVQDVGEVGLHASGLVTEWQWSRPGGQ